MCMIIIASEARDAIAKRLRAQARHTVNAQVRIKILLIFRRGMQKKIFVKMLNTAQPFSSGSGKKTFFLSHSHLPFKISIKTIIKILLKTYLY